MRSISKSRAGIVAGVTVGVLAIAGIGGAIAANAADSTPSPSPSSTRSLSDGLPTGPQGSARSVEEELTGDAAAKVEAAVKAKYPDATIVRMEKDSDGDSVYEAHITKADGTHVKVMLDDSFAITGEDAKGPGHGGKGRGHHGGHGQSGAPSDGQGDSATSTPSASAAA